MGIVASAALVLREVVCQLLAASLWTIVSCNQVMNQLCLAAISLLMIFARSFVEDHQMQFSSNVLCFLLRYVDRLSAFTASAVSALDRFVPYKHHYLD